MSVARTLAGFVAAIPLCAMAQRGAPAPSAADARLRDVQYDPHAVVTVPVKRGVVALVELDGDEAIAEVAAGLGGDCTKADAVWCIAAQPGSRYIFVKAKSGASAPNNLAVVTDRRSHAFRFVVLADADSQQPVYRIAVHAPLPPVRAVLRNQPSPQGSALVPLPPVEPIATAPDTVAERLTAAPQVVNSNYSLAEGETSTDIVPTLVFDDGRFTYLKFPGNREVPAVFHVLGDGSETLVNTRMEDDLLVVDRVSRRLMLRSGHAVVGIWNEAFDLEGVPPSGGTTVGGVRRVVRTEGDAATDWLHEPRRDTR